MWYRFGRKVKRAVKGLAEDVKAVSDTVVGVGVSLIILAIMAIIFGYVMGLGSDLTGNIANTTIRNQTSNYISTLTNFGFSMFNFMLLIVLVMIAVVIIYAFRKIGGGEGGGGAV